MGISPVVISNGPNTSGLFQSPSPRIQYLGHATTLIELDGVRLLTDPLLRQRTAHLRRSSRIQNKRDLVSGLDVVLISHMHWDHLDIPSLRTIPPGTIVFGPVGSTGVLRRAGLMNVVEMRSGDRRALGPITVEATPANHEGSRPPFGPDGEAIGFLISGSRTIYFAGDTDLFDEMSSLTSELDVALLPIWGWGPSLGEGHLDPERAAIALTRLQPEHVVPIHWGTLCPIGLNWARPRFLTRPPHEFARAARLEAPDVNVRIIQLGDDLELAPVAS